MSQRGNLIVVNGAPTSEKNALAEKIAEKYKCSVFDMRKGYLPTREAASEIFDNNVSRILEQMSDDRVVRGVFVGFPCTISQARHLLNVWGKYPIAFISLKTKWKIAEARFLGGSADLQEEEGDKKDKFVRQWDEYVRYIKPAIDFLKHSVTSFSLQASSLSNKEVYKKASQFLEKEFSKPLATIGV